MSRMWKHRLKYVSHLRNLILTYAINITVIPSTGKKKFKEIRF